MTPLGFAALALSAQLSAPAPAPQGGTTYVLTQAFCLPPQAPAPGSCREQSLPVGATLEIQLPGTPSTWKVTDLPSMLKAGSTRKLASPGRIDGTREIYIFTFAAVAAGDGKIVFTEAPPHMSKPGGTFTFLISVTNR